MHSLGEKLWINANVVTMVCCEPPLGVTSPGVSYGLKQDLAIGVCRGKIVSLTPMSKLKLKDFPGVVSDLAGRLVTPGFIDCHTHLIFAGDRSKEFELRLQGMAYQEIARQGGGILSTVEATRDASLEELTALAQPRLTALMAEGVTTIEIKSGYGLNLKDELKILQVARHLAENNPVTIFTTLLSAHALPAEYQGRADDYIQLVCEEIIPAAAESALADAVDVFCEGIGFSLAQCEAVYLAARTHGLSIKAHAEQFSNLGGAILAAGYGALSVDHLEYLDETGVQVLAKHHTVATLLPGPFYFLKERQCPPVDLLRQHHVPIAIASDFNPGSSPLASLRLMMNMACVQFGLTPEEALAGVTCHAARALGVEKQVGTIELGRQADFLVWNLDAPGALSYQFGLNDLYLRIQAGEPTHAMYKPAEMHLWQGRVDEAENEGDGALSCRWHQKVQRLSDAELSGIALLGFACDEGVRRNKGRPGAASGPDAIRSSLANMAWHHNLVYDAGNVSCQGANLEHVQRVFAEQIQSLLTQGHFPLGLGGGHELAYASFLGLAQHLQSTDQKLSIGIINFDAHFDLRDDRKGPSSGTPFLQIAHYCQQKNMPFHYFCLGISQLSNTASLFERADKLGVSYLLDEEMSGLNPLESLPRLDAFIHRCDVLYLTIDMDVFPASLVPGVSAPATRGIPLEVVEALIQVIRKAERKGKPKLRLADLAEYNPVFDIDQRGARIAARLVYLITRPLSQ